MNNCRGASFKDALSDSDVTTSGTYDNTNPIVAPLRGPDSQQSSSQFTITGTASCSYDAQNRLRSATVNGVTETFLYDGLNRKFSQTISGVTTVNVWDGWNLIQEYNSGSSGANYSYVYGVGGIIERLDSGGANAIFYFQDALGNTAYITDSNGNMVEYYRYDRFGNVTIYNSSNQQLSASSYDIRHLYTGQLWMPQIGLYDLRNRVYSATLQRFMQADPVGFGGDRSHLYRYCGNNSINNRDPQGTQGGPIWIPSNRYETPPPGWGLESVPPEQFNPNYSRDLANAIINDPSTNIIVHGTVDVAVAAAIYAGVETAPVWLPTATAIGVFVAAHAEEIQLAIELLHVGHVWYQQFEASGGGDTSGPVTPDRTFSNSAGSFYGFSDGSYGVYDSNGNGYYIWSPDGDPGEQIGQDTSGNPIYQQSSSGELGGSGGSLSYSVGTGTYGGYGVYSGYGVVGTTGTHIFPQPPLKRH